MDNVLVSVEDLLTFVEVADAGGFTSASRRTGIPKSRLSRRVASLETYLGVALLRRDARRFSLTELGERICAHGRIARLETQMAVSLARESLEAPSGHLRVTCPSAIATTFVSRIALQFSTKYPRVLLTLESTDGRRRSMEDSADLLIQPSTESLSDSSLIARKLVDVPYALFASPALAASLKHPCTPKALAQCPAIGWSYTPILGRWFLIGPASRRAEIELDLRFVSDSLKMNCDAALHGLGIAQLPLAMGKRYVRENRLVVVAPAWRPQTISIYALYPSRRHLTPAGRCFLDMLADGIREVVDVD